MRPPAPTLLLVDDDDVDVLVLTRIIRKQNLPNRVVVATDGLAALARLRGTDGDAPLAQPYVILLDLNLPRMGGLEMLAELRSDPELRRAVVFVLTTSDADADIDAAYAQCVAGYACKRSFARYSEVVDLLAAYSRTIELPMA